MSQTRPPLSYRQALAAHEEAIAATPLTAPDRPGRLNKLAVIQAALAEPDIRTGGHRRCPRVVP